MRHDVEFESNDGLRLCGRMWEPDRDAKAVIGLIHGLGEHSDRYGPVANIFNRAGFALITFDLRGHGRSEGRRGHAPNYSALMSDIGLFLKDVESRYTGIPCFLYGHSLGGNLAIHYALLHKPALAGVIVTAPFFRMAFKPPAWKTALLDVLNAVHINIPISTALDQAALSRDLHAVRLYQNDPLVHDRITPALAVDMQREGAWNLRHAPDFPLPILLMHGEADRITSVEASVEFAAHLEHKCTLKIWDGCYHELHNEPEKETILSYALAWMNTMIP